MRASKTGHSLVEASEPIGRRHVFRTEDLTEEDIARRFRPAMNVSTTR
jgi:hypothetical protein